MQTQTEEKLYPRLHTLTTEGAALDNRALAQARRERPNASLSELLRYAAEIAAEMREQMV